MALSILPLAFEDCAVGRNVSASPILLSIQKLSVIYCSILVGADAMPVEHACLPDALIHVSIFVDHFSLVVDLAVVEDSRVLVLALLLVASIALLDPVNELPFINGPIGPLLLPKPMGYISIPLAFVGVLLVLVHQFALPFCHPVFDVSFIVHSVRVDQAPFDIWTAFVEYPLIN